MNYGELKKHLKALAFEEEDTISEYEENDVIPTAINRAISMIGKHIPIMNTYEFIQDGTDTEYQTYDFSKIVKDFLMFDKHPVRIDDGEKCEPFGDYLEWNYHTLKVPGDVKGTFIVQYKAKPARYQIGMDDVEIPLEPITHEDLLPLLCAYFVWLDDDATKAAQYYNLYETELANIMSILKKPRLRFLEGGI